MFSHFEDKRNINASASVVELNGGLSSISWTGEYNTEYYYPYKKFNIGSTYQGQ